MHKTYLTVDETKKHLKLAKSTIYTYVQQNKIPHIKIGERVLFDEDDLDAWMASKKKRGGQRNSITQKNREAKK